VGAEQRATNRAAHAQAGSYTSVQAGGQTHTHTHKGTKRETGVSGNGLGNPATTIYYFIYLFINPHQDNATTKIQLETSKTAVRNKWLTQGNATYV